MKQNEIGLVLYTVRDRAEKDFAGMMREVAAIGYGCAEVCGTFGLAAEQVRALGEETGLRLLSAHVGMGDVTERFDATAEYYRAVGVEASAGAVVVSAGAPAAWGDSPGPAVALRKGSGTLGSIGCATEPTLTRIPPSACSTTGTCFSCAASVVFSA